MAAMRAQSKTQESPRLKHNGFNIRGIFPASAGAVAITLAMSALAQDAARLRAPRRQGVSELKASDSMAVRNEECHRGITQ
jgi:hypothetical protein